MDDMIELILGRRDMRGGDGFIGDLLGRFGRWIRTCGCIAVLVVVGAIAAVLGGLVTLSEDTVTIIIVFITMFVAVISLIRTSMGQ